jgi:hypothetical protein
MNICLLTDNQKSDVFKESRKYTAEDFLDLSILASANETFTKAILSYCLDTNNEMDRGVFTDLFNILTWLAEPMNAFFSEIGAWGHIPKTMLKDKKETATVGA